MPHKKKNPKQATVDEIPKSVKIGLIATGAVLSTPSIMSSLYKDSIYNAGGPGYPAGAAAVGLTGLAAPVVGVLAAGVSELVNSKIVKDAYKHFRSLPVLQQVVLGLAAYNILVGAAVGGSYFMIANAAAREYFLDAALHFLNACALNSQNKYIHAIALVGNIARMMQIERLFCNGTSTIPDALNITDSIFNHPFSMFGLATKLFGKSLPSEQPTPENVYQASINKYG